MICICVKADPEVKQMLIEMDPEKYLRPAYISRFGWLSIRIDTGSIDWNEIGPRLADSYRSVAPKRLVKAMQ
jgi:phosphoribosylglycinamide formyltransferase-1